MIKKIKAYLARRKTSKLAYKQARATGAYHVMTTSELLRTFLLNRMPIVKNSVQNQNASLLDSISQRNEINYIAVAIDGYVQEVIRMQNRLAAIVLSDPEFISFDPKDGYPEIGVTEVVDGKLVFNRDQNV